MNERISILIILFSNFSGLIREGESYLIGPLLDGTFLPAKVTTIHRYRVPRRIVYAGQAASLNLLHIEGNRLRKVNYLILFEIKSNVLIRVWYLFHQHQ